MTEKKEEQVTLELLNEKLNKIMIDMDLREEPEDEEENEDFGTW